MTHHMLAAHLPGAMRLLMTTLLCLLLGCPGTSEWDREWERIQTAISQGQIEEAKLMLQRLLPSAQENGPRDHRYGLIIYQLGEVARLEGRNSQAEALYWEALPLFAESLGPEHLRMADPLAALATLYQHKGQLEVALPLYKRALAIREKTLGHNDPLLLPTLQAYHELLLAADRTEEAMEISRRIAHLLHPPS